MAYSGILRHDPGADVSNPKTENLSPPAGAPSRPDSPATDHSQTGAWVPQKTADGAPAAPPAAVPAVPGYEIYGVLGRGGMGVVYRARQEKLNRVVALKAILSGPHSRAGDRLRFRAEAEVIARIQHPNIIQIHDVIDSDGLLCLSLEFCGGGSLQERLAGSPLPPAEAARLVLTLAGAIHAAHEKGIIHRDLKPANVLLTEEGVPKITDFGLAKKLDEPGLTASGVVMGTPSYMAPEQALGQVAALGPATDGYALGAILYECLTGRAPFKAATAVETILQVVHKDPVPPSQLQPKVPRDLETICLKCLEKSPARRYPDARELADDLRRFLDGEPIRARPLGMAGKAVRWARRRPAVAGLLAAVVLSLTAGFVLVSGQWLRANREWSRAEEKAEAEKKAKGEAEAAGAEAKEARRRAEERQAHLALTRGRTLCEQGEIDQGLLWLARALELSETAAATALDRPLRVTLADWARQLPRLQFEVRTPKECRTLAFVPQSGLLAATGNDGRVHFWNAASGKKDGKPLDVYGLLELHPQVWNLAFSRDGKTALTGGSEGRAALWDVAARRRLHDLPHPPGKKDDVNVWGTGLSPDGRLAATGVTGGFARLWDVATGRPVGDPLRHGDAHDTVFAVAFSTNGQELYTASRDSRLRRWAAPTGERVEPPLVHESLVEVIACSPDGRTVLTGTREGAVRLWDTRTWQAHRLPPQGAGVIAAAFSPDGSLFATGTRGGWVRLWDAAYRLPVGPVWRQDGPVSGVAFSPDGQALAIGEEVGTIRVWALPRLNTLGSLAADHRVQDVAFDRAGHALLMAGPLGACLRDGAAGRFPPGGTASMTDFTAAGLKISPAAALSPDGKAVATGHWSDQAVLWDAATKKLRAKTADHQSLIRYVSFTGDGLALLSYADRTDAPWRPAAAVADRAALWDVASGRRLRPVLKGLATDVNCLSLAPDGKTLLLGCPDRTARLWDLGADRPLGGPLRQSSLVTAVAFRPDGRQFLTGCRDGEVRLWDTATRTPLGEPLRHPREVTAAAFSPDGGVVLVADQEGTAASGTPRRASRWACRCTTPTPSSASPSTPTAAVS